VYYERGAKDFLAGKGAGNTPNRAIGVAGEFGTIYLQWMPQVTRLKAIVGSKAKVSLTARFAARYDGEEC
jgi:hypothetical protein